MTDRLSVRRHLADLTPRELAELELRTSAVEMRRAKTWRERWAIVIEEIGNLSVIYLMVGLSGLALTTFGPLFLGYARTRNDGVMLSLFLVLFAANLSAEFILIPAVTFLAARRIWRGAR